MLSIIAASLAPAIALLSFFYLKDDFDQEPIVVVGKSYFLGAILVFPIMFIQFILQEEGIITSVLGEVVIQSAFIEEFLKWFVLMLFIYNHIEFNQRYDGIVYGTAVALGFATAENVLYIFSYGVETAFLRAVFPVSSHALFGVVMGYYLSKAKFNEEHKKKYLLFSFSFPFILHAIYNFILLEQKNWLIYLIPFMIFLWILGLWKIKKANKLERENLNKQLVS